MACDVFDRGILYVDYMLYLGGHMCFNADISFKLSVGTDQRGSVILLPAAFERVSFFFCFCCDSHCTTLGALWGNPHRSSPQLHFLYPSSPCAPTFFVSTLYNYSRNTVGRYYCPNSLTTLRSVRSVRSSSTIQP